MMAIKASALIEKFQYALANHWGYIWGTAGVEWTQAKQNQKVQYMVNKYGSDWKKNAEAKNDNYYGAAMYGSKWIGHTVADCSGLFAWAFKQLGGSIAHGSNSIYDRYCTSDKGKITDNNRGTLAPGTAVFVNKNGNKSHIGLYVGNGKVIEASGTQAGVCTSNLSAGKWTYYGRLKNVEYGESPTPPSPTPPDPDQKPTLRRGSKGEYVTLLQTKLVQKGYSVGSCGIDGDFGRATENAVKQFQRDHGLNDDGVVGKLTWDAIEQQESNLYTVTIPSLPKYKAEALVNSYPGASMKAEGV